MSIASVQWLIESRPPGMTWSRPSPSPHSNQPQLDLSDHEADRVQPGHERSRCTGEHGQSTLGCTAATRLA
jgi:hypothetical protein